MRISGRQPRSASSAMDHAKVVPHLARHLGRAQFVTFTAEELKALDVESSKIVDLESFVPRGDIDPVYLDSPYYLYLDGAIAVEALRVIGAAMTEAGVTGIGRLTLGRRERMVLVEPRGPEWRCSRCAPQTRFGRRSLATTKAISMPRWSRSPARSFDSAPEPVTQASTATGIKMRCER